MARSGAATLLVVCVLAATGMFAASFVGGTPGLRGSSQRTPSVAMNLFDPNYTPPTSGVTTPPPTSFFQYKTSFDNPSYGGYGGGGGGGSVDPNTYIIGISALMIASVYANTNGFFGPW